MPAGSHTLLKGRGRMVEPGRQRLLQPVPYCLVPERGFQAPVEQAVLHWSWASAKRMLTSTHPGLAGQSHDSGNCPGTSLFPIPPAFSFSLPPSTGFLPAQGCRMQEEAGAKQHILNFFPFPWDRERRKAAVLQIGINSHFPFASSKWGDQASSRFVLTLEGPTGACI